MRNFLPLAAATIAFGSITTFLPNAMYSAEPGEVRTRAEQSFDRFKQQTDRETSRQPSGSAPSVGEPTGEGYSSDRYWIGHGQGDLSKGKTVCQRVSELSARTDLAKQIRVLVKEHMVDRVREGPGREPEQDIELIREELVQEYLQGVKIVDYRIDEETKTCTATAVMPKSQVQLKSGPGTPELPPTVIR